MCNLYSMTRNQDAIRRLFKVTKDSAGNLPASSAIFPDGMAPVVRGTEAKPVEDEHLLSAPRKWIACLRLPDYEICCRTPYASPQAAAQKSSN